MPTYNKQSQWTVILNRWTRGRAAAELRREAKRGTVAHCVSCSALEQPRRT
jgi:hypothetical protein